MSIIPRLRTVKSMPQLEGYIQKHSGSIKGRLNYTVFEQMTELNGASVPTAEREDSGNFQRDPESSDIVAFFPKHPDSDEEMFSPEKFDAERVALDSVSIQVRSRHIIS